MNVVTICQRKGGNGKSTLTLNLAAALAEQGKKVLLIDTDDQKNTTSTIPTTRQAVYTVEDLLFDKYSSVENVAEETCWDGIHLIAGSRNLSAAVAKLEGMADSHKQLLKKLLYSRWYDFCLIDTSPSLNMLTINAMCASGGIIIPLSSNYYSLEGLAQTLEAYRKVKEALRKDLSLYGAAFVIHDGRSRLANEVQDKVKEQYPDLLCETVIGRNIKIEEAQVRKQSILSYAPSDRGAVQYRLLARELMIRMAL
ncbi:MAG: ParA family protein [Treponema sp.]|nr:ParA family protein [Treponema sp.]